ncbi:hypothetical protein Si131_00857 [Streptococcus infantarius subsp. infantarius]|nr:hypothetical protein [Streptococcus infantarius subsp. infantarius]
MLESYAIQQSLLEKGNDVEIINFSSAGQRELYDVFSKNKSLKDMIKNFLIIPAKKRISVNNEKYEEFKRKNFLLSEDFNEMGQLSDSKYDVVVAGSDQIWNITIADYDDAYFLPWVKSAKKVAYAPSFGSKNIMKYSKNVRKYEEFLNSFDALSIREKNGKKWIKDICGKDVNVLIDPTLLLDSSKYDLIIDDSFKPQGKYIFFYCPSFNRKICRFVKKISDKYNLPVITWSTKSYFYKFVKTFGFKLVPYETPSLYLSLIKNAELVITTSYHGTIFSTIYRKKFITVKNGEMYGDDDRVMTLLNQIGMENRLLPYQFDSDINYLDDIDYSQYESILKGLRETAEKFIEENVLGVNDNEASK